MIRRMRPGEAGAVLALVRASFAAMEGRIDPPSSMHRLTEEAILAQDGAGEVWVIAEAEAPGAGLGGRYDAAGGSVTEGAPSGAAGRAMPGAAGSTTEVSGPGTVEGRPDGGTAESGPPGAESGPILACVFLSPLEDALYVGKLAVADSARGRGLSRRLIETAAARAQARGLAWLELQVRVELVENHAIFERMGFLRTGATAHPGYDRPTSLTFRRPA